MEKMKTDSREQESVNEEEFWVRIFSLRKKDWPKVWWALLNDWWPQELSEVQLNADEETRRLIAKRIENMCGIKACMRYYNTAFGGMDDQMFDDYWDSTQQVKNPFPGEFECCPERLGEKCAAQCGKNGDRPIVAILRALLFGGLGGFIVGLLLKLLQFY